MSALQSVLIQKSTGQIIKQGFYPREDMQPIQGLDPDYEYLVKVMPFLAPDYDPRIFILNKVDEITTESHPEYPWLNVYKTTYTLTKRNNEEIAFHIKQAQKLADQNLCSTEDQLSFTIKMQNIIDKQQQGLAINADEQLILDRSRMLKVKLDKNQDNYNMLMSILDAGLEPNIDEGWENA